MKLERKQLFKERRRQRADTFFAVYYEMGPERSLEKLQELCAKIGLKRALSTFKLYSVEFGWQNRILEVDAKLKDEREKAKFAKIEAMNDRQAQDARNLQAIARAGMTGLVQQMRETGQLEMQPQDIATLLEKGARLERLALGEATDRLEAISVTYNIMLLGFVELFKEVNLIKDAEQRMRTFALRIDDYRNRKFKELGMAKE